MQNKLQELTDKLYQEGLSKGKAEGEQILAKAKEDAAKIVADASKEADAIVKKAQQAAAELSEKAASDVKMASSQALQATKKDIENIILGQVVKTETAELLQNPELLKEIILCVAKNFNAQEPVDLEIVLPESLRSQVEPWAGAELAKTLKSGVKASFSKKIAGGFTIGPADGSYYVSLTDETFEELICEYLRPVTKELLFGK